MNINQENKSFVAITYDNNIYHFVITPEDEIFCNEFGITYPAKIFELKPSFVLRDFARRTVYSLDEYARNRKKQKSLVREYIIDDDTYKYLIEKNMLMYSIDMAELYGFDPQHAYDRHYHTRAYKRVKDKTRRLEKQKKGQFH